MVRCSLTVNHGDHAVPGLLAGHAVRDGLHTNRVAFVGLQLGDQVQAGLPARAA